MKAAKTKTKARVAVTEEVAVAGVEDADDALRMGAGRGQGLLVSDTQHCGGVLPQELCIAGDGSP